ncbi:unnamed protein product [Calypogeia fissa]
MAKRERLGHLKFMQRAKLREEQKEKEVAEEVPVNENEWTAPAKSGTRGTKCVVIVEGDPSPGAASGRMTFQSSSASAETANDVASQLTGVGSSESSRKSKTVKR